jgi:hypothetical protein
VVGSGWGGISVAPPSLDAHGHEGHDGAFVGEDMNLYVWTGVHGLSLGARTLLFHAKLIGGEGDDGISSMIVQAHGHIFSWADGDEDEDQLKPYTTDLQYLQVSDGGHDDTKHKPWIQRRVTMTTM